MGEGGGLVFSQLLQARALQQNHPDTHIHKHFICRAKVVLQGSLAAQRSVQSYGEGWYVAMGGPPGRSGRFAVLVETRGSVSPHEEQEKGSGNDEADSSAQERNKSSRSESLASPGPVNLTVIPEERSVFRKTDTGPDEQEGRRQGGREGNGGLSNILGSE